MMMLMRPRRGTTLVMTVSVIIGAAGSDVLAQQHLEWLRRLRLGVQADMVLMLVLVPVRRLKVAGNGPASSAADAAAPRELRERGGASAAGIPEPVRSYSELGGRRRACALAGRALGSRCCPLHCPAEPRRGSAGDQLGSCMNTKRSNQHAIIPQECHANFI